MDSIEEFVDRTPSFDNDVISKSDSPDLVSQIMKRINNVQYLIDQIEIEIDKLEIRISAIEHIGFRLRTGGL